MGWRATEQALRLPITLPQHLLKALWTGRMGAISRDSSVPVWMAPRMTGRVH